MVELQSALKEHEYGFANIMACFVEAMGMLAENEHRQQCGNSIAYGYDNFVALIEKYGIHHNAILSRWESINY